jgi:hypothetical protein
MWDLRGIGHAGIIPGASVFVLANLRLCYEITDSPGSGAVREGCYATVFMDK